MANDFGSDENCVALWSFENDLTDSVGGNDLAVEDSSDFESTLVKEGSYSNRYYNYATVTSILDADLDAGFPFKNGDTNLTMSVCFWARIWGAAASLSTGEHYYYMSKMSESGGSWAIGIECTGAEYGQVNFYWWDGEAIQSVNLTSVTIYEDLWYHIGVTYDGNDQSYRIRVYDEDGDAVYEVTGTTGDAIAASTTELCATGLSDDAGILACYIDELVMFNDVLTADEIDQTRSGEYGSGGEEEEQTSSGDGEFTTMMFGCPF